MTCFRPLPALRLEESAFNDSSVVVLPKHSALQHSNSRNFFQLPCGKCVGCKLSYSRGWAVRCIHESQLYEFNSFVTLTYNDHYNDLNSGSLNYTDFTLFIKRLRKALSTTHNKYAFLNDPSDNRLRFFMCGEYGTRTFRPHFHALFFNLDFDDKVLHTVKNGFRLYTSESLSSFWTDPVTKDSYGHVLLGSVTVASAGYVSRYCVKKALESYQPLVFNSDTGEFLAEEKTNMSRRPGIAKEWFDRYSGSVYPHDEIVMANGRKFRPPRFYDNQLEKLDPSLYEAIKASRIESASSPSAKADNSVHRLIVKEKIQLKKLDLLPRFL